MFTVTSFKCKIIDAMGAGVLSDWHELFVVLEWIRIGHQKYRHVTLGLVLRDWIFVVYLDLG